MGNIASQFATAFRDFATEGVASSGPHEVIKEEVRAIGPIIEAAIGNAGLGALVDVVKATSSDLNADLAHPADTVALVYADATDANNDLYIKVGASGSGSWTLTTVLHDIVAALFAAPLLGAQTARDEAEAAANETEIALASRVPANNSALVTLFRAIRMGTKHVLVFNAAGEAIFRPAASTISRILGGLLGSAPASAQTRFRPIAKRGRAWTIWDDNGTLEFNRLTTRTLAYLSSALSLATRPTVDFIHIYGQSNAVGSLSYSQTWRTPWPVWDAYPPGFAGTTDGALLLSTAQVGASRTFSSDFSGLVALDGLVRGCTSEGVGRGMLDGIATKYPGREMVVSCTGVGGVPIEYLDKPTSAEITAGSASGVTISTSSAEYLMQVGGKDMSHILDYALANVATPYYRSMWQIAKAAELLRAEGKSTRVTMTWLHGEGNATDTGYQGKVEAFYDQYKADVALLTGQSTISMLLEQPQYSPLLEQAGQAGYDAWVASGYLASHEPGGVSSAYTAESARTNSYFLLNGRQAKTADDGLGITPARRIFNVGPTYPFSSLVHRHPHAARNEGENFAKVFSKVEIEGQDWQPLQPISYWWDTTYIYVRFHVPQGSLQMLAPPNAAPAKTGLLNGFEHSAGNVNAVTIIGKDLVRITPAVAPASGQALDYVKTCRTGNLCDQDNTVPVYTDRAGSPNVLRNYCIPFSLTL